MAEDELVCPHCGPIRNPDAAHCPRCGVTISITPRGATQIHVVGQDATEVQAVSRQLSASAFERREARRLRSPWFSGLFYLTVVVVVIALLLVAGRVLALWALPVVVVGAVLLVTVVGAFQLRADDRLAERNFVKLMGDVLRRLPLVFTRARADRQDDQSG
jgi:hypothetical protein